MLKLPACFLIGFPVEAVIEAINLVFFLCLRAGVNESGNALLLEALGIGAAAGASLAIIRKLRAFLWVGYGLSIIGMITMKKGAEQNCKSEIAN